MARNPAPPLPLAEGRRILICAPYGRDAESAGKLLAGAGYETHVFASLDGVAGTFDDRTGAILLTEEALRGDSATLEAAIHGQPEWSDVPFILLTTRQTSATAPSQRAAAHLRRVATNVVMMERPLGIHSLLSAVEVALRSRRRQFTLRDRLAELAASAESLRKSGEQLESKVVERTAALQAEMVGRDRAESALRQAQKMEAVGQLTGGIAHDFNNMLQGIMGAISLIQRRIASGRTDDIPRFLDAASASAVRAANLTQRLLAFSRRQSLDPKPTDINDLVGSLEDLLRRTLTERISLRLMCAPGLVAGIIDANQLESALLNLAINARDAMPDGGTLTIATSLAMFDSNGHSPPNGLTPGKYVQIAVSDTGVGMPPQVLEKAFDPFFTTKPLGQGTGLGLSMVYGFARQSGGLVQIDSTPGAGTTVRLLLPAAEALATPATVEQVADVRGDGRNVLVVDDEDAVRLIVKEVIEELGYTTLEAGEPQSAIAIIRSSRPIDLMISDVGLPGMSGRELAEVARQHRPDLPILFITGYAENAAIRADFLGANMAMVPKPFRIEELNAKIAEIMRAAPPPALRPERHHEARP